MASSKSWRTVRETARQFAADKCPRLAASLAYYTVFALAPLLVIVIAIAGLAWGHDAARDALMVQVRALLGSDTADMLGIMLDRTATAAAGWAATAAALGGLVLGATAVFGELQGSINTIWGVAVRKDRGLRRAIVQRVLSFGLVVVTGFLLLVSLVLSAAWQAIIGPVRASAVGPMVRVLAAITDYAVSVALFVVLLAAVYKVLPDCKVHWRDVWLGAGVTAVLLAVGKYAIGLYLGHSHLATLFGPAGSLAVLLAWLYYAGLIFFLGAEFTQVQADLAGRPLVPKAHAVRIPTAADVPAATGKPA